MESLTSVGAGSPVPVSQRTEEVTVLCVGPEARVLLLCSSSSSRGLLRGGGGGGGVGPPVPPVGGGPAGLALLAEAFLGLLALQAVHHLDGHLATEETQPAVH